MRQKHFPKNYDPPKVNLDQILSWPSYVATREDAPRTSKKLFRASFPSLGCTFRGVFRSIFAPEKPKIILPPQLKNSCWCQMWQWLKFVYTSHIWTDQFDQLARDQNFKLLPINCLIICLYFFKKGHLFVIEEKCFNFNLSFCHSLNSFQWLWLILGHGMALIH